MNVKIERRYSEGLQFSMSYTWSTAIDDIESRHELGNWRDNVIGKKFFNTTNFVRPDRFTFGNVGRNIGISPGAVRADLSVIKEIYMPWEGHSLQFRGEALNFINRANFAVPNRDVSAANFGAITSLIGGNQARIMQVGLRYSF